MANSKRYKIENAGVDTKTGRNRIFLEGKGWRVDDRIPNMTCVRMRKDGEVYFYYLLGNGSVRRGETRGRSISVKLKIQELFT